MRSKPLIPPISVIGRDKRDIVSSLTMWFAARPKAEDHEGPRTRSTECRAALSLVCLELLQVRTAARQYRETRQRPLLDPHLTSEAWQEHRAAIALELSLSDWTALVSAYEAVNGIRSGACDATLARDAPAAIRAIRVELITPMLREIERGCVSLAPYALDVMGLPTE